MEEEIKEIKEDIKNIKDNHLVHIYSRLGLLTGGGAVLIALSVATFVAIWVK